MKISTRLERLLFSIVVSLIGVVILGLPYALGGLGLTPVPPLLRDFLEALGATVLISGTVSFGVQELVSARTREEFKIQLRRLLETAGAEQSSQLHAFLESYISELAQLTEQLRQEVHASNIR